MLKIGELKKLRNIRQLKIKRRRVARWRMRQLLNEKLEHYKKSLKKNRERYVDRLQKYIKRHKKWFNKRFKYKQQRFTQRAVRYKQSA